MTDEELFTANGCVNMMFGDGTISRFAGWMRPPAEFTPAGVYDKFLPSYEVPKIEGDKVFLWEAIYHALGGKYPTWNWQLTGSCVNGGYNNNLKILMGLELVNNPQPESWVPPFTLHTYGLSRYLGWGETREGEGSFGLSMAKAGSEGGVIGVDDPEVDKPHLCGPAEVWNADIEYKWSSIRNHPASLKDRSKKYRVEYVRVHNKEEAEDHLRMRHPLTWAGDWGGQGKGVVKGTQYPILTMPRKEQWQHQQSCWGVWKHPELNRMWYIQNQWWNPGTTKYTSNNRGMILKITQPGLAIPMHGHHPVITAQGWNHPVFPTGGYWVTDSDMDYQCKNGEVCALVMFDGFTGRPIGLGGI